MTWESGKVFAHIFIQKCHTLIWLSIHWYFPPFPWNRFTILEKESMLGGTWFKNSYPGCECDVFAHFYSFSFCLVSSVDWKALLTFIPLRISTGARHIQGRQKSWATSILWRPSLGFFPTSGSTRRLWEVSGMRRQRFGQWRLTLERYSKVEFSIAVKNCTDKSPKLKNCSLHYDLSVVWLTPYALISFRECCSLSSRIPSQSEVGSLWEPDEKKQQKSSLSQGGVIPNL